MKRAILTLTLSAIALTGCSGNSGGNVETKPMEEYLTPTPTTTTETPTAVAEVGTSVATVEPTPTPEVTMSTTIEEIDEGMPTTEEVQADGSLTNRPGGPLEIPHALYYEWMDKMYDKRNELLADKEPGKPASEEVRAELQLMGHQADIFERWYKPDREYNKDEHFRERTLELEPWSSDPAWQ